MSRLSEQQVFAAISRERQHQRDKYGPDREQSLAGYLVIAKKELDEAFEGWMRDLPGRNSPLYELCQVAAVCVAAMEAYGTSGNTISTLDIAAPENGC